ncbi:Y-box-binding protein 2 isoform X5 [Nannospalax galili]|nr:Y-box-binding protein 2 isoform X5 [Nannospalax galili]
MSVFYTRPQPYQDSSQSALWSERGTGLLYLILSCLYTLGGMWQLFLKDKLFLLRWGAEAANVTGPGGVPVKGSRYAPNRRRFHRFIPRPRLAAPPPMVAEAPSGGTEPGSEGERAEDSGQRPRRRRPPPFFYRRRFVRGPRPPNQQQPIEGSDGKESKETAPLEGDQQQGDEQVPPPRFRPRYRRPFRPRPPQQPTTEGGDGETQPSQGPTDGSRPEPQRPRNRPYFQRRRQQPPGPRQPIATEVSASFQLTLPSILLPPLPIIHDIKTSAFPLRLRKAKGTAFGFFSLFFFPPLPYQRLKEGIHPYCSEASPPAPKSG